MQYPRVQIITLVFWFLKHIEIEKQSAKFAEKLIVARLFFTISIATNKSQTRLTIKDTEASQIIETMGVLFDTI